MTSITLPRAVVQQVLEALEFLSLDFFMLDPISPGRESTIKAITALRAALAQQAEPTGKQPLQVESVAAVAENATTQQQIEQTPPSDYRRGYWAGFAIGKREGRIEAEDALAQQAEPVAWECKAGGLKRLTQRLYDMQPDSIKRHYTRIAPPQRKLVPLTEEEIFKIENDIPDDVISDRAWTICLTRAVEKAVWEKNHGQA